MIKKIAIFGTIILCTLLLVYCTTDEETMIGPLGNAGKYITANSFKVENDIIYADGDSTTITIVILDVNNSPLEGLKVSFSTNFGTITESDITDSTGTAEAVFISDENIGETTITASTGAKNFTIPVEIIAYQPTTIELSAESVILLAGGNDYTKITAIPRDENGFIMDSIAIQFNTSLGTLGSAPGAFTSNTSFTANSGAGEEAVVYLRSADNEGTAGVTATAGIVSSMDVYFYLEVPSYIAVTASPKVVMADGSSSSTITATVFDETGAEMEGMSVLFSTTAGTLGYPPVQATDENGIAEIELTSSEEEETAVVTASASVSDTVSVKFTMDIPYHIDLTASPTRVIADGSTVSTITAAPKDKYGDPMIGIDVNFETDLGKLNKYYITADENGVAEAELTSNEKGTATVTASVSSTASTASVIFYEYNPVSIKLDSEESSILADGFSQVDITAQALDASGEVIPGAVIDFSTNYGTLDKTTGVIADQNGDATVTLTSEGSTHDLNTWVKAEVQGYDISDSIAVKFRGIILTTHVDSSKFVQGGFYNVYVRSTLTEKYSGDVVDNAAIEYSSTIGTFDTPNSPVNEYGEASAILSSDVTGYQQSGLIITAELPSTSKVFDTTSSMAIPGVETIVSTIDDEIMGDGESWALVKTTLRETTGKAITNMAVDWETTHGTIIGQSLTNTTGFSIDTLSIEEVSQNTNVTISSHFGNNVSDSETVTIIAPITNNRLVLGFEPDTTGHGYVPCDIDTSIATRDVGINAHFVDENGNGIDGETISFSVVPNNLAAICPAATTIGAENGRATVMMAYPPQNVGQIVRVWGEAPDGTRGNIDVILPKDEEEDDGG